VVGADGPPVCPPARHSWSQQPFCHLGSCRLRPHRTGSGGGSACRRHVLPVPPPPPSLPRSHASGASAEVTARSPARLVVEAHAPPAHSSTCASYAVIQRRRGLVAPPTASKSAQKGSQRCAFRGRHMGYMSAAHKRAGCARTGPRRRETSACPGVSILNPQLRDKNRRDKGKSQSKWTAYKMETPGSQLAEAQAHQLLAARTSTHAECVRRRGGGPGNVATWKWTREQHRGPPTLGDMRASLPSARARRGHHPARVTLSAGGRRGADRTVFGSRCWLGRWRHVQVHCPQVLHLPSRPQSVRQQHPPPTDHRRPVCTAAARRSLLLPPRTHRAGL
jgi:hypothetical protein